MIAQNTVHVDIEPIRPPKSLLPCFHEPIRPPMSLLPCFHFLAGEDSLPTQYFIDTATQIDHPLESVQTLRTALQSLKLPWKLKHHANYTIEDLKGRVCPSQNVFFLIKYNRGGAYRWGLIDAYHSRLVDPSQGTRIQRFGTERRGTSFVDLVTAFFLQNSQTLLFPIVDVYSLHNTSVKL